MAGFLLDTNIVSDLLRNPQGRVLPHLARVGEAAIALSIITAAELRYGAARSAFSRTRSRVEAILTRLPTLPLEN